MAALKKYDINGQEIGQVVADDVFEEVAAHGQMVKDYLVALRANQRQWSSHTKVRSEVAHSNQKPHRQKGTGNARQGSLASPQYKGGGIVFGPRAKFDQCVRVNRKEKRKVIGHLIAEKMRSNALFVVEDKAFGESITEPRTKQVAAFLKGLNIYGKKVLFLGEGNYQTVETEGAHQKKSAQVSVKGEQHKNFIRSMRNIPKTAYRKVPRVNGYDLMAANCLVVTESGLKELSEACCVSKKKDKNK